jgi:hypothetical protein
MLTERSHFLGLLTQKQLLLELFVPQNDLQTYIFDHIKPLEAQSIP